MAKALFLDRDGITIIVDKHYLADPAGVELIPGAAGALQRAAQLGYLLFLVHQPVGQQCGLHSLDDDQPRHRPHGGIVLIAPAAPPAGICVALEAPDQPSLYLKPSPRYIHEMIAAHSLVPGESVDDR